MRKIIKRLWLSLAVLFIVISVCTSVYLYISFPFINGSLLLGIYSFGDLLLFIILLMFTLAIVLIHSLIKKEYNGYCINIKHEWDGCVCVHCGAAGNHDWGGRKCKRCGIEKPPEDKCGLKAIAVFGIYLTVYIYWFVFISCDNQTISNNSWMLILCLAGFALLALLTWFVLVRKKVIHKWNDDGSCRHCYKKRNDANIFMMKIVSLIITAVFIIPPAALCIHVKNIYNNTIIPDGRYIATDGYIPRIDDNFTFQGNSIHYPEYIIFDPNISDDVIPHGPLYESVTYREASCQLEDGTLTVNFPSPSGATFHEIAYTFEIKHWWSVYIDGVEFNRKNIFTFWVEDKDEVPSDGMYIVPQY